MLLHPNIQAIERTDRRRGIEIAAEMPEASKARRDVKRDIITTGSPREPRPGTVSQLHLRQFLKRALPFVIQAIVVEKNADILACLAFGLRLTIPGCLLNHHALEVLIFFQRAV